MAQMINPENKPLKQQREQTIKRLEANFAHGNLDVEEFERRLDLALNTSLPQDLERLTSDLTVIPSESDDSSDVTVNTGRIRRDETFTGILSGIKRTGVWKPARNNRIFTLMGGVDLDFSQALLPPGVTDIEFLSFMGGIDIKVPEGINVEVSGLPIMGSIEKKVSDEHYPGRPTLRIHGVALMAGVEIKHPRRRKKRRSR